MSSYLEKLLDLPSWKLTTPELLQQLATLAWVNDDVNGKEYAKLLANLRIGYDAYCRLSSAEKIESYHAQCYSKIALYLQENPKANKSQIEAVVKQNVEEFRSKINNLDKE